MPLYKHWPAHTELHIISKMKMGSVITSHQLDKAKGLFQVWTILDRWAKMVDQLDIKYCGVSRFWDTWHWIGLRKGLIMTWGWSTCLLMIVNLHLMSGKSLMKCARWIQMRKDAFCVKRYGLILVRGKNIVRKLQMMNSH